METNRIQTGDVKISNSGKNGVRHMTYKQVVVDFNTFVKAPDQYLKGKTVSTNDNVSSKPGDKEYKQLCGDLKRIGESVKTLSALEVFETKHIEQYYDLMKESAVIQSQIFEFAEATEDNDLLIETIEISEGFEKIGKWMEKMAGKTDVKYFIKYFTDHTQELIDMLKKSVAEGKIKSIPAATTDEQYMAAVEAGKAANYDPEKIQDPAQKAIFNFLWQATQKKAAAGSKQAFGAHRDSK